MPNLKPRDAFVAENWSPDDSKTLRDFLGSAFTPQELRRLVESTLGPRELLALPPETTSTAELVVQTIALLSRAGAIDGSLFDLLLVMRPRRADEIVQIRKSLLARSVAPPGSAGLAVSTLPREVYQFQGRSREVGVLTAELLSAEPVTLTVYGSAGIGKSALILHVLRLATIRSHYGAHRYFVRLDTATTVTGVVALIASYLGIDISVERLEEARQLLGAQRSILVLDDLEAPFEMEPSGMSALILALSTIETLSLVLSFRGVTGLAGLPRGAVIRLQPLASWESLSLFLSIAPEHRDSAALPTLLQKTAGIPLAVVLLAHYAEGNDLANVLRDWELRRTDMLVQSLSTPDRITSWAISIELSWTSRRMTDPARRLASLLAVLPAGISLQDLEALCGGSGPAAATTLVHVGLAHFESARLHMLLPVSEHIARHAPPGDDEWACAMKHFSSLITAYRAVRREPTGLREVFMRLVDELANVNAVVRHGLDSPEPGPWADVAAKMGDVIRFSRRIDLAPFHPALVVARRLSDRLLEARLLRCSAEIERERGHLAEAEALLHQGRLAASEAGNASIYAELTKDLGAIALRNTMLEAAELRFEEAITLATECDARLIVAQSTGFLAKVCHLRKDGPAAQGHYTAALSHFRALGTLPGEPWCIMGSAWLAADDSDYDKATALASQAIGLYQSLGLLVDEAACVRAQGTFAVRSGDDRRANEMFLKALELFRRAGNLRGQALCESDLKELLQKKGTK